ncbi:MAG: hypothetical protein ACP5G1_03815, partial [Nanopusillaceae archaeon]
MIVSLIPIFESIIGLVIILIPLLLLQLIFIELRKSIIIYYYIILGTFIGRYILQIEIFNYFYIGIITILIALLVIKYSKQKISLKNYFIEIYNHEKKYIDINIIMVSIIIISLFIPINQNWDYYAFYIQPIYNNNLNIILPLFNNIFIIFNSVYKMLDVPPRAFAIFFDLIFYLVSRRLFKRYIILVIFIPSIFILLIYENLYLEISSFTILMISLSYILEQNSERLSKYTSFIMLFWTKINIVIIGFILIFFELIHIIQKKQWKNLLILLMLLVLPLVYFVNNYYKYDAFNFEEIPLYRDLVINLPKNIAEFWITMVSGVKNTGINIQTIVDNINAMGLLVYMYAIPSIILLFNYYKNKIYYQNRQFIKITFIIIIIYIYGLAMLNIDIKSSIFTIRYLTPITLIIYTIFLKDLHTYDDNYIKLFTIFTIVLYIYLYIHYGPFMKENFYIYFTTSHLSLFLFEITIILFTLIYIKISSRITSLLRQLYLIRVVYWFVIISFLGLNVFYVSNILIYDQYVNVNSSVYNLQLHHLYPKFYSNYFVSYYENDILFNKVMHFCNFTYSIGGIYNYKILENNNIMIRGGHFSYLPFIL